ncbi:MAG TPA: MCE family protein [Mycobacteriales bacterium]|nr:MCE family protein [Mycobacteriales bacterium]
MSSAIRVGPSVVKLAVFGVVTLLCTAVLAVAITNATFSPKHTYRGVFADAVGVRQGDDVRMAGVRVGSVEKVELHDNELALVTFEVEKAVPLADSTRVEVRYRNLIGQRYLALIDAAGDGTRLEPGSTIPLTRTSPALDLNVLFNGFKPLLVALDPDQVNTLAYELVRVLQGEGGTVTSLLGRLSSLTNSLADRDQLIGEVVDNLNALLGPVAQHNAELSALVLHLQQFVSGLAQDREAIGSSLASIGSLADSTAGLLQEGRPALRTDIAQLGEAAAGLNTPTNRDLIQDNLDEFPTKLKVTAPLVSYGSWVNFYLCAVNFKYGPTNEDVTPVILNSEPRCQL